MEYVGIKLCRTIIVKKLVDPKHSTTLLPSRDSFDHHAIWFSNHEISGGQKE
jgi:hypothetical protein